MHQKYNVQHGKENTYVCHSYLFPSIKKFPISIFLNDHYICKNVSYTLDIGDVEVTVATFPVSAMMP